MPKIRYTDLPTIWSKIPKWGSLIQHEYHILVSPRSKLRCKVCTFKTWKAMDDFFYGALGRPGSVCRFTQGICSRLFRNIESYEQGGRIPEYFEEIDRRYFAFIGLIHGHITPEIVIHECIHAGCAYAERVRSKRWCPEDSWSDEEAICYPSSILAAGLLDALRSDNILEEDGFKKECEKTQKKNLTLLESQPKT